MTSPKKPTCGVARRSSTGVLSALLLIAAPASGQDTVRVRADNPPLWGDSVRLVRELSIGTLDGPPEYAFGKIAFLASLPSGAFFVYDSKDTVLRRYDARGKFLGAMGRGGEGPGEFRWLQGMRVLGDSLIVTWDPRLARLSFFSPSGQFRRALRPPGAGGLFSPDVFATDRAGRLLIRVVTITRPASGAPVWQHFWARYSASGQPIDSIPIPPEDETPSLVLFTADGPRRNFIAGPIYHLDSRGGLVTGSPSDYRFVLRSADGKPLVVQRRYRPVVLGNQERSEWLAIVEGLSPQPSREGPPMAPAIPKVKPAFRDFAVDALGRIWVEVYTVAEKRAVAARPAGDKRPPLTWHERSVFEVLDEAGRYLGRVELPPAHQLMSIQRNRVWLISEGPDGEPVISVYRIQGPRGPR